MGAATLYTLDQLYTLYTQGEQETGNLFFHMTKSTFLGSQDALEVMLFTYCHHCHHDPYHCHHYHHDPYHCHHYHHDPHHIVMILTI